MERPAGNNRAVAGHVFFASLSSLAFEIALMRVFSISLWYHFAFMVISIAMLGIAASGALLSLRPALKDLRGLPWYGLMLALSIPASYLLANAVPFDPIKLSWDRTQLLVILLYYIILGFPFFCFGLIVSSAYSSQPRSAHAIYAADLTGAGIGAIAMIGLLSFGGPDTSMFIISAFLTVGLVIFNHGKMRIAAMLLLAANLALLLIQPAFIHTRMSAYKPLALALQFPGAEHLGVMHGPSSRIDLFKSPAVRFAPGLSLNYLEPLPDQTGVAVDGADIFALTDERDSASLGFVRFLPSSLAFKMTENRDVLIIEPCAGLSLLTAKQFKALTVAAIDSNPLLLRAMRDYGRTHGSSIHEHQIRTGLARTWLASTNKDYDVIDLSVMGSFPSTGFGFAEDYRFTIEAFKQYLAHVKPEGFLAFNLYLIPPPRTELRLLTTLAAVAEGTGMRDLSRHLAVMRSWNTVTVLIKKAELTREDIERIKMFAREMRFDLVHYPGITMEETNIYVKQQSNDYAEAFQRLINRETRERFVAGYLFDIQPTTDEKPFFRYHLKIENIGAIYRVMGEKWQYFIEQGWLLPILFVQALVVSFILILLPLLALKRNATAPHVGTPFRALSYFAFLGAAYLFIETAFIQKMMLSLENPSYAASTVIASVLISSGIGSLLSERIGLLKTPRTLVILAGLVVIYSLVLPGIIAAMGSHGMAIKIILCFITVAPAGFLMGIPFPLGISALGSTAPGLIPWAWAVNGCFSVLAPILATMLALSAGFSMVLFFGAMMYLAAFWVIRREWKDREEMV